MPPLSTKPDDSHLVAFRTSGAGAPLFCFPGSGGNVHVFRELIAVLPEGQPVYAVDMEWLCETGRDFTVEQLAAFCLDIILKIQRGGPYYFCGYSFGGLVAYEIATQLINKGESAGLVALLDAPNPALRSNLSKFDSAQFRKAYLIGRLKKYGRHLAHGEIRAFSDSAFSFVTSRLGRYLIPFVKIGFRVINKPFPGTLRSSDPGFLKAWNSYVPKQYPKRIVCFRVEDRGPEHNRDPSMGWETCAKGGAEVHVVPGGHIDMMRMPSVRVVADKLAGYLDNG